MTPDVDKIRACLIHVGATETPPQGLQDWVFGGRIQGLPMQASFRWDMAHPSLQDPIDMRPGQDTVENQGNRGECVGEGWSTTLELLRTHRGLPMVELSPDQPYYDTRVLMTPQGQPITDSGSSAYGMADVLTTIGICRAELWNHAHGVNDKPDATAYADAALHKVGRYERLGKGYGSLTNPPITQRDVVADLVVALSRGLPAVICFPLSADVFKVSGPLETHPAQGGFAGFGTPAFIGAHCVSVIGWKFYNNGRRLFILENSWGPGWGDGGFWGVDEAILTGYCFDCFVARSFWDVAYEPIPWDLYVWDGNFTAILDDGHWVTTGVTGAPAQAYRLYKAAFNRVPDEAGLGFWIHALQSGATLLDVAGGFVGTPEFQGIYAALANRDFVLQLYRNVLGREGDATGIAFWVATLDNGGNTRAAVLQQFSESPENRANTDPVISRGIVFQPVSN